MKSKMKKIIALLLAIIIFAISMNMDDFYVVKGEEASEDMETKDTIPEETETTTDTPDNSDKTAPTVVDFSEGDTKFVNTTSCIFTLQDDESGAKGIYYWTELPLEISTAELIECNNESNVEITDLDKLSGDGEKTAYFKTVDNIGNISGEFYTVKYSDTLDFDIEKLIDGNMEILPAKTIDTEVIYYANQNTIYVQKNDSYSEVKIRQISPITSDMEIDKDKQEQYYVVEELNDEYEYELTIIDCYTNRKTKKIICDTTAPELNISHVNNVIWTKETSIDISGITEETSGVDWNATKVSGGTISDDCKTLSFTDSNMECKLELIDYAGNCNIYTIKRDIAVNVDITKKSSGTSLVPTDESGSNFILLSPAEITFDFGNEETGLKTFAVTKEGENVEFQEDSENQYKKNLNVSNYGTYIVDIEDGAGNRKSLSIVYKNADIDMRLYKDDTENKTEDELAVIEWASTVKGSDTINAYGHYENVYLKYSDDIDPSSITINNERLEGKSFTFLKEETKSLKYRGWNETEIKTITITYDKVVNWKIVNENGNREIQNNGDLSQRKTTDKTITIMENNDISGLLSVSYKEDGNDWTEINTKDTSQKAYIDNNGYANIKLSEFGEQVDVYIKIIDLAGNESKTWIQYDSTLAKLGFDGLTDMNFFEAVPKEEHTYEFFIKDEISDIIINHVVKISDIHIGDDSFVGEEATIKKDIINEVNKRLFADSDAAGSCEISYNSLSDNNIYKTIITKDITPPTIEWEYNESAVKNKWIQSSVLEDENVILVRDFKDEESGINKIVFSLGDKSVTKTGEINPTLTLRELTEDLGIIKGKNVIIATAYDNMDNKSIEYLIEVCYDTIPPEISIAIENSNIWSDDEANSWIKKADDKNIIINVTKLSDEGSKISKVEFAIKDKRYLVEAKDNSLLSDYQISLEILKKELNLQEGENTVTAQAFDMAGNPSEVSQITIFYDNTPPKFNLEIEDSKVWEDSSGRKWIKAEAEKSDNIINIIGLKDSANTGIRVSGVEKVIYELNGATIENVGSSADNNVHFNELINKLFLRQGENKITVTAYDNVGNWSEKSIYIYYDKTAPTISSKLNTSKMYKDAEGDYWVKSSVTEMDTLITVNCSDVKKETSDISGMGKVIVEVRGNKYVKEVTSNSVDILFKDLISNFELRQGENTITITAYDNAGNASKKEKRIIFYDTQKPVVQYKLNNAKLWSNGGKKWILSSAKSGDFIIDISGTNDNESEKAKVSGIERVELILRNKKIIRKDADYKRKIVLSELVDELQLKQGYNSIDVIAYDRVGNVSDTESIILYYDTEKPRVQASLAANKIWENDSVNSIEHWIKNGIKETDTIVNIDLLTDEINQKKIEVSGIQKVVYKLGKKTVSKKYSDPVATRLIWSELKNQLKIKEGLNVLEITAYDNVGNCSDTYNIKIYYDKTKPVLKTSINPAIICSDNKGNKWIKAGTSDSDIIIKVDQRDDDPKKISKVSGIQKIEYKIGEKTFDKQDAGITLGELKKELGFQDGKHKVSILAYDNVGQKSEKQTIEINYDTKEPAEPVIKFDDNETQTAASNRRYGYFFNRKIRLLVQASDGETGSDIATINVNNLPIYLEGLKGYTTIDVGFKGILSLYIKDMAGNELNVTEHPGVIVEDKELHEKHSSINIMVPETAMKDAMGLPLYNQSSLPVSISVEDGFSGIQSVEWTVSSDETDKAFSESGKIDIDADGKATYTFGTGENAQSGQSMENSFMSVQNKDFNLVTKLGGTLEISDNSNGITLTVILTDNAQNKTTKEIKFSNDTTVPVVTISYDNNSPDGIYRTMFREERTATIRIQERNFRAEDVMISAATDDGKSAVISDWTETAGTGNNDDFTHIKTIRYSEDGEYTFNIAYKDLAGNEAKISFVPGSEAANQFTIDRTAPVINITYDNNDGNNGYFKDGRTATITINEHNFSADRIVMNVQKNGAAEGVAVGSWSSSGDVHSATITFDDEAQYTVQVSYTDMAGNVTVQTINESFYVDKMDPEVIITGVESEKAYNADIIGFRFEAKDFYFEQALFHLAKVSKDGYKTDIEVNERTLENGKEILMDNLAEDGIYQLAYVVTDKAGRTVQNEFQFSVNRNGSSYIIDSKATAINKTFLKAVENDIQIMEVNVNELDMNSILLILTKGSNTIELKEGVDYTLEKKISADKWCQYIYTIKKSCFDTDGEYSLTISSKDALGNISVSDLENKQADISFVVDKTLPLCNILNLKSNTTYAADGKNIELSVSDNIKLAKVSVFLNGVEIVDLSETELDRLAQADQNISFDITSKSTAQNLEVVFEDKAGNSDTVKISNFYVTTNPWIRFKTNPAWRILFIAGVVVITFGIIGIIVVKKKKKHNY